jgi:hypothetical protein
LNSKKGKSHPEPNGKEYEQQKGKERKEKSSSTKEIRPVLQPVTVDIQINLSLDLAKILGMTLWGILDGEETDEYP